jgi:hypothetical protein
MVGRAEEITDADAVGRLALKRVGPWAGGEAATWIRIVPIQVTGRRICASDNGVEIRYGRRAPSELQVHAGPAQRFDPPAPSAA